MLGTRGARRVAELLLQLEERLSIGPLTMEFAMDGRSKVRFETV